MKGPRHFILLAILLSCTAGLFAQSAEKTLVRSFNLQGANTVVLKLDTPVTVTTWNQPIMRIQMTISLESGSDSMLKSLIQAGRYNFKPVIGTDSYVVEAPGLLREVLINGSPLAENISLEVFAPTDVAIEISNSTSAGVDF